MICVYENFKDLPKRKASDKALHEKAIDIAKPPRFDGYHCELASMIYKLLIKVFKPTISRSITQGN